MALTPAGLFKKRVPAFTVVVPDKVFAADPPNVKDPVPIFVRLFDPEMTPVAERDPAST